MRWLVVLALVGCCPQPPAAKAGDKVRAGEALRVQAQEIHLADLRQLTFGGENAEAYWSFDGKELIFQASPPGQECDQIYRMKASGSRPVRLSGGAGATTCSYFLPGNKQIIYASTHLGGARCPPEPDRSQGYVWALYPSYDIFRADRDGKNLVRLTNTPGYDAEATVCPRDGSIIFTSLRDGDLELYRMDADGKNVKRLTETPGYDGGAFFNDDCSKIVWRASRPSGTALDDYRRLLKKNLVRPTKLEIYVGNADGSEARQITYLDAASFAPYWFPSSPSNGRSGKPTRHRIVFSSNYRDPKGREFDIWAVDESGANLERITFAPGFDGFPMFSPDGRWLLFSSNRGTPPDSHDTNVFLTAWNDHPPQQVVTGAAERIAADAAWLAEPAREGRGVGTQGLQAAGAFLEQRLGQLGLAPLGDQGSYRAGFELT
ncbi:MAG TPA: hypothetical protein VFB62_23515, partial [Polyangiaceae bacterium]|nr:hypothetical protein [Polyangiaceae bacterium]